MIHVVADAAYHGPAPRTRGDRLGTAWDIAAAAAWATVTVTAYGREQVRHVTEVTCLWYGTGPGTPARSA